MNKGALWLPDGSVRAILAIGSLLILSIVVLWTRGQSGLEALVALTSINGREYWEFAKARLPQSTKQGSDNGTS